MLRLRHHHLLCLLTYVGKGYSSAFVANLDRVAARASAGESILLVEGPDDVCAPLTEGRPNGASDPHCLRRSVRKRDTQAARALSDLLGQPLPVGSVMTLTADAARRLRAAFAAGTVRAACADCQWHDLCSAVAKDGFSGARLAQN